MTPARRNAVREMAKLQRARFAEFGGFEAAYQVAIDPSELIELLDRTEGDNSPESSGEQ